MLAGHVADHALAAAGQAVAGPALQALAAVGSAALAARLRRILGIFLAACACICI